MKETKYRPALVISSSKYNETAIDVVVLRVTSRSRVSVWESEIINDDLAEGTINIEPSYVRVDSIYAVEKEIIRKIVAQLKEEKIKEIKTQLLELFS